MRQSVQLSHRMWASSRPLQIPLRRRFAALRPKQTSPFAAAQSAFRYAPQLSIRYASTEASAKQSTSLSSPSAPSAQPPKPEPSYLLTFTCKPCTHRSTHRVTKQGYHHGTVLITCPSCKNRHVISDHLNVFLDHSSTLEDILRKKAGPGTDLRKMLKKGRLGMREGELVGREGEEDVEFWDDGTETKHQQ